LLFPRRKGGALMAQTENAAQLDFLRGINILS
jgi:hypothetical protein